MKQPVIHIDQGLLVYFNVINESMNELTEYIQNGSSAVKNALTAFLGSLELPKVYRWGLHRYTGIFKKFGHSSTLIFRRNSHQKKVQPQCAQRTTRVKSISQKHGISRKIVFAHTKVLSNIQSDDISRRHENCQKFSTFFCFACEESCKKDILRNCPPVF